MPKKQKNSRGIWRVAATLAGVLGFLGILGELEITGLGRSIYTGYKTIFGTIAWIIPTLCLVFMIVIWKVTRPQVVERGFKQRTSMQKSVRKPRKLAPSIPVQGGQKGIHIPKGKLVSLQGFGEYFASTEGPEIESAAAGEELNELGRDFSTYFQEGQEFSFRHFGTKLATIKGFPNYFDEVQSEYEEELKKYARPDAGILIPEKKDWLSVIKGESEKRFPGQVAQLLQHQHIKTPTFSGIMVQDELGNFQGRSQEKEYGQKIEIELEQKPELESELESERKPDLKPDFELEQEQDLVEAGYDVKECSPVQVPENEVFSTITPRENITEIARSETELTSYDEEISIEKRSLEGNKNQVTEPNRDTKLLDLESRIDPQAVWSLPEFEQLDPVPHIPVVYDTETQKQLERVLADFGIQAKVIRVTRGPVITRYELAPAPGVKISRIVNLADDIALGLAARDVRIEAPIPGKAAIGIEVPNKQPRAVPFREVLETSTFKENSSKLKTALGKDISDQPVIADLAKMPHVLIAGATGAGKSVCITALINSILFNARPDEVKFLMVDPKMVELSIYNGIPHLLAPVVIDPKKAAAALKWVVKEMETRYELFAAAGVRDIERYNRMKAVDTEQTTPALPWIVVIIDELADLMMVAANDVEEAICRLAQMARAAGIHLVIATQRPSVDVITGVIKANIPSRISFAVSSQIDSRTILDATGAEKLLGRGDMLYSPQGLNKPMRVQGCYVSDDEVQRVISYWKAQGKPEYLDPEGLLAVAETKIESSGPDDELFVDAGRMLINTGMASVSFLQRKLKLGYARAARLMDLLEENGVVGGYEGSKPRQVLMALEEFEERFG